MWLERRLDRAPACGMNRAEAAMTEVSRKADLDLVKARS